MGDELPHVRRVVTEALSKDSDYNQNADVHSRRTTSSIRNDQMVDVAKKTLVPRGFVHIQIGQRNLFELPGKATLHFKKLSRSFKPHNVETQLSLRLFEDGTTDVLPGFEPLPLLTVGFVLDTHGITVTGIYMTQIQDSTPQWVHCLDEDLPQTTTNIVPITPPYDPSANTSGTKIHSKDGEARKQDTGDSTGTGQS